MTSKNPKKPAKILVAAFIATCLYTGYDAFTKKNNIHSVDGAISLITGDEKNPFWREVSKTDKCTSVSEITPETTYVDIVSSAYHCIIDDNYQVAAENYVLAFPYATYDKSRVGDTMQHAAADYINAKLAEEFHIGNGGVPVEFKRLNDAVEALIKDNETFCSNVKSLEPPKYTPHYMINYNKELGVKVDYASPGESELKRAWRLAVEDVSVCHESEK